MSVCYTDVAVVGGNGSDCRLQTDQVQSDLRSTLSPVLQKNQAEYAQETIRAIQPITGDESMSAAFNITDPLTDVPIDHCSLQTT